MSTNADEKSANSVAFKIGFKFNKTVKPKTNLLPLKQTINSEEDIERVENGVDFITTIDNNQIKSTINQSTSSKKDYVIPLIVVNKYRLKNNVKTVADGKTTESTGGDSLIDRAKQELIEESKHLENHDSDSNVAAWKSLVINKAPDEYENDSKLDVSIRPEESKMEDYEQIPIEAYGLAMLRGMGWNEGEAIGGINKSLTPVYEPILRPKGLGLGANASLQKQLKDSCGNNNNRKNNSDDIVLRKGCYVCVELGPYKGFYGTIESISDDLSHVLVKLYLSKETIDLPQALLRVVSKKEFEHDGRIINKSKYDDYKSKDCSLNVTKSDKNADKSNQELSPDESIWIMPKIRAKIMDKNFKNGKYYKEKVVILETSGKRCTCKTRSKRILEDISQSMLQTVIPRDESFVKILLGQYRGKLATVERVDYEQNNATVKLCGVISKPITLSLDSISECYDRD